MKSQDAMVVWTPNREPFENDGTRGSVAVTTIPEKPTTRRFSHSVGACDFGWIDMNEADRQSQLRELAKQMIDEDNIKPDDIERAFSAIDCWTGV